MGESSKHSPEFTSEMGVELIDSMGNDVSIARAARISTGSESVSKINGLVNFLMKERHGVPFESVVFTFKLDVPIFVARQLVKHRISSMNETSGRYRELEPKFWVPHADRGLVNAGTSARPEMVRGDSHETQSTVAVGYIVGNSTYAWNAYRALIEEGVASEVARAVLPLNTYTSLYWTVNLRSLFNALALRVNSPDAAVPSRPQAEIEEVFIKIEEIVREIVPVAHEAFVTNGRVAP